MRKRIDDEKKNDKNVQYVFYNKLQIGKSRENMS
jgi:hypothetical protein